MRKYFEVLLRIVAGKCWGFPGDTVVKNLPDPWVKKIPWSRKWPPTLVFLPGKFQWQRSLAGYSPWGHKESDTTEHTQQQKSKRCISLLNKIITKWEPGQKRKLGKHSLGQFGEIWLSFFFSPDYSRSENLFPTPTLRQYCLNWSVKCASVTTQNFKGKWLLHRS